MVFRLPTKSCSWSKYLKHKLVFILLPLLLSSFAIYFFLKAYYPDVPSTFAIEKFYLYQNTATPGLYLKIKNKSLTDRFIFGQLFVEDKLRKVKRQINLGNMGKLTGLQEKEYAIDWQSSWSGTGVGQIKIVLRDQEGLVSEKGIFLTVVPSEITDIGVISLFASMFLGAGFVVLRFV